MGRHADPDARHFYGSLVGAAVRGLLAVALAVGLYLVLASVRPGGAGGPVVVSDDAPDTRARPSPTGEGERGPSPIAPPATHPSPASTTSPPAPPPPTPSAPESAAAPPASASPSPDVLAQAAPPSQTTVQVLDGVGDGVRARRAAAVLRELGYDVVAVNAAVEYSTTTVLYSRGHEAEARALMARDRRFAALRRNPNLSESVDLHVVVGRDWPR
ncbi:MAG TPA: LytR C-terminal domain-containing protein [Egibacteraceae bacterium]|nr:LytR C-terminal domain-containing protein [Egibacteraceae bacterium]